ncbi:hypothetical protein ACE2AJ_03030 [Aquihabitans daechungensis]|uniref:hypothetical protein n=1 Tax=Aquihabitans daechungensis TaxID=1052257 RepID=UPI003B9F6A6C
MTTTPIPVAAPAADPAPAASGQQCGRCRQWFPVDPGPDGGAAGDWWACPPCHDALFPNRPARAS